jgi:hypothetical protein
MKGFNSLVSVFSVSSLSHTHTDTLDTYIFENGLLKSATIK